MMWLGPVLADRLTLLLLAPQQVDERPPEEEAEDERGEEGAARAEGDVAEEVEEIAPSERRSASKASVHVPCAASRPPLAVPQCIDHKAYACCPSTP
jgi:hypothetical protein